RSDIFCSSIPVAEPECILVHFHHVCFHAEDIPRYNADRTITGTHINEPGVIPAVVVSGYGIDQHPRPKINALTRKYPAVGGETVFFAGMFIFYFPEIMFGVIIRKIMSHPITPKKSSIFKQLKKGPFKHDV